MIRTRRLLILFILYLPVVTQTSLAQVSIAEARQLEARYKGKLLRVRELVADGKIRYNAAGKLIGNWHAGRWTWHSTVEITGVKVKDRFLKIEANRLLLNYSRSTHKFTPARSGSVEIEIETSPDANGNVDVDKEWNKAFLTPTEDYPLDMQPYWKPFIACVIRPKSEECEYYETKSWEPDVYNIHPASSDWKPAYLGVSSVGGDVMPPKVRSRVDPTYTSIAQAARVQGTVMLEAIVRANGRTEIVRVIRPLGYGLEENAAEALGNWVFEPGTRSGQPVDVLLTIEINFNLR
jgi:TonB family protein